MLPFLSALCILASSACAPLASNADAASIPAPIRIPSSQYYYGVLAHPWTIDRKYRRVGNTNVPDVARNDFVERLLDSWQRMGVRYVRIDYPGYLIQDRFGNYDFRREDDIADRLLTHGMVELPVCLQYGASRSDNPSQKLWSSPQAYATFCGRIASHIKDRYPQFQRIELMNEPTQSYWWEAPAGNPYAARDGSATAAYLLRAYAAVKLADPSLKVVAPALGDGGSHNVNAFTFFDNLYTAGCRTGRCWDIVSIHNYAWVDPSILQPPTKEAQWYNYKRIQQIAVSHGDPVPHVMLTEVGFCRGHSRQCQDARTQALFMAESFNLALADPTVDGITWQNGAHPEGANAFDSMSCEDDELRPYPCFYVFQKFSRPAK